MQDDGAGSGQEDGQPGSGAPGGGSPEGGSENDDKPITAKQLKAALESQKRHYEGQLAGQRAEFEAFKQGVGTRKEEPPADKPKRYTRAQLNAAVEQRQITQEQADEAWASQIETDATERAVAAATAAVAGKTQKERIDSELESYKRLKPEIMESGSELREKVTAEFKFQVETLGMPGNGDGALATQLAALRAVLGPVDKLQKAAGARRSEEHHQEGGSGGDSRQPGKTGDKFADQLDPRWREHYANGIKQGRYKDWKEVEAEAKFATPKRRQEMGLRG